MACGEVDEAIEVSVLVGVPYSIGVAAAGHVPDSIVAVGADAKGLRLEDRSLPDLDRRC